MPISELLINNFKGVADRTTFEIRPITLFSGPNSSGKSSCIHAIAALSQTAKLSATQLPIVLDDEYAQVHLGRFIDVIHSRSFQDAFQFGIGLDHATSIIVRTEEEANKQPPPIKVEFSFRAKSATQEIYIETAKMSLGSDTYSFKKKTGNCTDFQMSLNGKKTKIIASSTGRLGLQPRIAFRADIQPADDEMQAFFVTESVAQSLYTELRRTLYLGPFRQGPLRRYPTRGSQPKEVGAAGEAAVTMLANEYVRSTSSHPNLARISDWLDQMGLGKHLQVSPVAKTDLFDVSVTLHDGAKLSIPDLGYGVSQVLPVLVQCSFAPKDSTLLFEQPELHLHEGASRKLAGVFVDTIREKGAHIIAETHSPHLFLELMQEVKTGRLLPEEIVLYDVLRRDGKSEFRKVTRNK